MSRKIFGIAACMVLVSTAASQTHKIQLRSEPEVGISVPIKITSRQEVDSRIRDAAGKELRKRQFTEDLNEEYTLTVLEQGEKGKMAKRFTRKYTRAETGDGKKMTPRPHADRTIVFERKGATYQAKVAKDEMELPEAVLAQLARAASSPLLASLLPLLPDREVKVGQTWTIPASGLRAVARGSSVDEKKSKGTAKLVKVYAKNDRTFGVITFQVELVLRFQEAASHGKIILEGSADAVIDGSGTEGKYTVNVTMTGENVIEQDGQKVTVGGTTKGKVELAIGTME